MHSKHSLEQFGKNISMAWRSKAGVYVPINEYAGNLVKCNQDLDIVIIGSSGYIF